MEDGPNMKEIRMRMSDVLASILLCVMTAVFAPPPCRCCRGPSPAGHHVPREAALAAEQAQAARQGQGEERRPNSPLAMGMRVAQPTPSLIAAIIVL